MTITTSSSREFIEEASGAEKAPGKGPVFITDRGRPTHVLLTIDEYLRMTGGSESIVDMLAMPNAEHIEFDPALAGKLHRPVDPS